ncbi:MAG: hydroxyethylthiazole kinase [Eubacteriaceae bacterium]|jgi:hydroxyethylthiazole kinase
MFKTEFENVRNNHPLIHNITNYVTVNDVANIILACGASPIMSDDEEEVEEITAICSGLNINIGTLNGRTIPSMFRAGRKARGLGHPVLLDPVGAGASTLRTQTAVRLMNEIKPDYLRGNMSEIKAVLSGSANTRGVDADIADAVTEDNLDDAVSFVKNAAKTTGSIIVVTGAIDLVADGDRCFVIRNGHADMSRVTGTGCQLSGLTTAFACANPETPLEAAAAAVCTMGLAGQIARENMQPEDGNATYCRRIIDAVSNMTGDRLEEGALYEIRS